MLLKTTQEVKQLMPRLLAKLNNNALLPNFDRAEQKYLMPLVGKDLYDKYVTIYQAGPVADPTQAQILKNMQLLVACHAFLDELGQNVATITDAGIQSQQTANMPRIYGWEFKAFKSSLQDAAADSVDVLLQSLWINRATLGEWTGSDAFGQFNSFLIKTAAEFNNCHPLFQPQRTFYAIKSIIRMVQAQVVKAEIGDDLINYFLTNYDTLTAPEKICLYYLQNALAYYTVKRACEHYSVRFSDAGFTVVAMGDPESLDTAGRTGEQIKSDGFLNLKMQVCERDGAEFMSKAKKELVKYAASADASDAFKTALQAGALGLYQPPTILDKKNAFRKIYRF